MNASAILNADMGQLARWGREAFDWWVGELASLVPDRLKRRSRTSGILIGFDGAGQLDFDPARPPKRPTIVIAAGLALTRRVILPAMSAQGLASTLRSEGERLVPLPAAMVCLTGRQVSRDRAAGTIEAEIAALPLTRAEALAAALAAAGITPARITIAAPDSSAVPDIDFLPLLRARGLVPPASQAPLLWWTIVGFLFLLNLFLLIWRDQAGIDALQGLVEAQRPAVEATQRVVRRIERFDRMARQSATRRDVHEPLALLGHVSDILPAGSFLLRFAADGDTLRLSGYKPRGDNLVTRLRQSDRLREVRNVRNDGLAEIPSGQPFDVSARLQQP